MTKKVRITIGYTWEISKKDWDETREFWEKHLEESIKYDPINVWWCLNQIHKPGLAGYKITKLG